MKTFFIGLLILGIAVVAFAEISVNDAENKIINIVTSVRDISANTSTRLGNLSQDGTDIVSSVGGSLDATDKSQLATYQGLITTAKSALDAVVAYKDTNWSDL